MKSLHFHLTLIGVLGMLVACEHPAVEAEEQQSQAPTQNSQEYLMASTLFVQQAAEYRALCYQAYNTAKDRLNERVTTLIPDDKPLAVVLDLDETVLDNSAYTAWQIANDTGYSPETWAQWCDLAAAPEVPGAGDFLNFAHEKGVTLFYVSNRDTSALNPTMLNMTELGHPQVEKEHFMLKTNTSDKSERRKEVESLGYDIALFIGDNLGDYHEKYDKIANDKRSTLTDDDRALFGYKYIILPNPLYGTWEGALYDFNRDLTNDERSDLRYKQLMPADF